MSYSIYYSMYRRVISLKWFFTFVLLVLAICSTTPSVMAAVQSWSNSTGNLLWGTSDNWNPSGVPDATGTAEFTDLGLSSGNIIDLGGDRSVGGLLLDTATNFTIGGSSGELTIGSGGLVRTSNSTDTQTIARPVNLGANIVSIAGTGELDLAGGGTKSGAFSIASGATLGFTGGTYNLIGANFGNSGTINFSGAAVSFISPATISGVVNFSQGSLSSTSSLTFIGPLNWSGGTISGNGATTMQGSTNYLYNDLILDGRTLTNTGPTTVSPYFSPGFYTSTHLYGKNSAIFNN